jgi:carbamoyltransferase
MKLLALRLCEHDTNFSYFDGKKLHYYKSERTTQVKHHALNNIWEWRRVIKHVWDLDYRELDEIAVVFDPWAQNLPYEDVETFFPAVEYEFIPADCKVWRVNHHLAHSLSTWMLTDKEPDVSIVLDGYGDRDTAWSVIKNNTVIKTGSFSTTGSFGTETAHAGRYLGVKADVDLDLAGKVMGLQAYGKINYDYLNIINQYNVYSAKDLFGIGNWFEFHKDPLVANLQPLDWIRTVHHRAGQALVEFFKEFAGPDDVVSYTGGVAQNVIWNTELKKHFKNLVIPPHSADDGLSLGAIEWLRQKHNLPPFTIENFPYIQFDIAPGNEPTLETIKQVAALLAGGKTVAWYQGHGEIGPRALGNRSILMDPRIPNGKSLINRIKHREGFRPFGASVLDEYKSNYFDLDHNDPYMLYVAQVKDSSLQAITHIDGTCRVQTVKDENPKFRLLLEEFYKLTGCPILLNTSLNLAGKPIAGFPANAQELFENSALDCLVIGDTITQK